jgi:site-specific DNA-methyltransferase (adenine-specific)
MGCGTTGIACKNTNRNFIGMENNDRYFAVAKERLGC